ncbi:MAG TPA: hypothetical protein VIL46_09405 [Gemmataceae bacterium]
MDDLPAEEVLEAIERAVRALLEEAGVTPPPVDALALARGHFGWRVEEVEAPPRRGRRRERGDTAGPIRLPAGLSEEARQAVAARRVGEVLEGRVLAELGAPREGPRPSLANRIAERLLLPLDAFARDARELGFDVLRLKERYWTASHEAIARRLPELPEPCVVALTEGERVVWRRGSAGAAGRRLTPAERRCREAVERSGEPTLVRYEGWTVQGWPLPGAGDRVLLRGVPETE